MSADFYCPDKAEKNFCEIILENTVKDMGFHDPPWEDFKIERVVLASERAVMFQKNEKSPNKPHQEWLNGKPKRTQDVTQTREARGDAQLDTAQMGPFLFKS